MVPGTTHDPLPHEYLLRIRDNLHFIPQNVERLPENIANITLLSIFC